jgi:rhodanese-related sulfurtransferase
VRKSKVGILEWFLGPAARDIQPEEAYQRHFETEQPTVIVDVRQPLEWKSGVIPGAVRIPLTQIGERMEELPRDRQILAICQSSHRSPIAARRLKKAGFEVLNVDGGLQAWRAQGLPVTSLPPQ